MLVVANLCRLVVHLPEPLYPVLTEAHGHLAEYHRFGLVAENVFRNLDLQVKILVGKVAEEDVKCFFSPPRHRSCFQHIEHFF